MSGWFYIINLKPVSQSHSLPNNPHYVFRLGPRKILGENSLLMVHCFQLLWSYCMIIVL